MSGTTLNAYPASFSQKAGIALVSISALVFSLAGIFTKGVAVAAWEIIFWRGLAAAGFTLAYLAIRGRLVDEIRAFDSPAALATCLMAAGTAAFIPAFKLTSVANVALIYATAPCLAAFMAWLATRERPAPSVIAASLVAFCGVLVIVSDSSIQGTAGNLAGDALAFVMTAMMAATMVVYRVRPDTTAALPAALSSVVLLPVATLMAAPFTASTGQTGLLVVFGLAFAIASVTLSEGARRLPSAQTALLSALEVPLAPVLAWLFLAEMPSGRVLIGGGMVLLAILGSQVSALSRELPGRVTARGEPLNGQ